MLAFDKCRAEDPVVVSRKSRADAPAQIVHA
jgi:hypothetical protein